MEGSNTANAGSSVGSNGRNSNQMPSLNGLDEIVRTTPNQPQEMMEIQDEVIEKTVRPTRPMNLFNLVNLIGDNSKSNIDIKDLGSGPYGPIPQQRKPKIVNENADTLLRNIGANKDSDGNVQRRPRPEPLIANRNQLLMPNIHQQNPSTGSPIPRFDNRGSPLAPRLRQHPSIWASSTPGGIGKTNLQIKPPSAYKSIPGINNLFPSIRSSVSKQSPGRFSPYANMLNGSPSDSPAMLKSATKLSASPGLVSFTEEEDAVLMPPNRPANSRFKPNLNPLLTTTTPMNFRDSPNGTTGMRSPTTLLPLEGARSPTLGGGLLPIHKDLSPMVPKMGTGDIFSGDSPTNQIKIKPVPPLIQSPFGSPVFKKEGGGRYSRGARTLAPTSQAKESVDLKVAETLPGSPRGGLERGRRTVAGRSGGGIPNFANNGMHRNL
ncbi:hypothetical protein AA313_de0202361 [Arthrobotrys entomopaga]|nr:hypothetical protein AA313_de0202361 [Arthrobotrys entomopaga]